MATDEEERAQELAHAHSILAQADVDDDDDSDESHHSNTGRWQAALSRAKEVCGGKVIAWSCGLVSKMSYAQDHHCVSLLARIIVSTKHALKRGHMLFVNLHRSGAAAIGTKL